MQPPRSRSIPDRLDVFRVAREFDAFAFRALPRRGCASLRDQVERASSSIVLNIAEGCGRFARPEKAHFYPIARGSATSLSPVGWCPPPRIATAAA